MGFTSPNLRELEKKFSNFFFRIMYELDLPSSGSQKSIAPNRFSKFDREHAFLIRLRKISPWDYNVIWTKILIWSKKGVFPVKF